jgi:ATP-dependent RNA helicase RhlE
VNFEMPNVPEDYVHRIGRTGRAGAQGEAISLVCLDEELFVRDIERLIKRSIPREEIPGFGPAPGEKAEPIVLGRMTIGVAGPRGGSAGRGPSGGRPGGGRHGGGAREGDAAGRGGASPRRSDSAAGHGAPRPAAPGSRHPHGPARTGGGAGGSGSGGRGGPNPRRPR